MIFKEKKCVARNGMECGLDKAWGVLRSLFKNAYGKKMCKIKEFISSSK